MTAVKVESQAEWHAQLSLRFDYRHDKTTIGERKFYGPLTIQKPFYPEGNVCHVYLLHPPGGVAPGDKLQLKVNVSAGAHALLTTPAAGKFYRSDGRLSSLQQNLVLADQSVLEWFPQETILFDGCNADLETRVELTKGSRFMGWEITCLGRPAGDELFRSGRCRQRIEVWREGKPLLLERGVYGGEYNDMHACWGLGGNTVLGTFVVSNATTDQLHAVRKVVEDCSTANSEPMFAVSLLDDCLVCRYLGHHAEQAKQLFIAVWQQLRPVLLKRSACVPRIWAT